MSADRFTVRPRGWTTMLVPDIGEDPLGPNTHLSGLALVYKVYGTAKCARHPGTQADVAFTLIGTDDGEDVQVVVPCCLDCAGSFLRMAVRRSERMEP